MKLFSSTMLAATVLLSAASTASASDARLCHIANAGFMMEAGEQAVLVDAVMQRDDYDGSFAIPSATTLDSLHSGSDIFKNVKLALVTHRHGDHYDAAATLKHIEGDPLVEYIMPPEAYDLLKAAGLKDEDQKRVHAILPDWESTPTKVKAGGIEVEVFRIDHGKGAPQNIGYRVHLGGKTFFHTGDINASLPRLKAAGLDKTPVDVLMIPFWYVLQARANIEASWEVGTIVPTHYQLKEQGWMERFGGLEGLRTASMKDWPKSLRIDQELQCSDVG